MKLRTRTHVILATSVALLVPAPAEALFRAYLSSAGSDANPCTLQQPCRLLPAALAATDDGGQVWMLDSANYNTGTVSITKSVTILAIPGAVGSVVVNGGHAIHIETPGVVVSLRNVVIGPVSGTAAHAGINAASGAVLNVQGCLIANLPGSGVAIADMAEVNISDTTIRDNGFGYGIDARGASVVNVTRTQVTGHINTGIRISPIASKTTVLVASDLVSSNNGYGIAIAGSATSVARAYVTRSVASGNQYEGFYVYSSGAATDAVMELSSSLAVANGNYGLNNIGGIFRSAGNNRSAGNGAGDTFGSITPTASY